MSILVEREAKFRLESWEEGERRLAEAGAALVKPRYFESNTLFDLPGGTLDGKGQALRLRRAASSGWLTFKGPLLGRGRIKERREVETAVGDPEAAAAILREIGLQERFRYEKYRACYRQGDLALTLDETPIGTYIEIEGSPEAIESAATRLGFSMDASITLSYPRLYQIHRDGRPELPFDMTFSETRR